MIFTDRVRALIKVKGITQDQFNQDVGISKNTLSYWEKESRLPRAKTLREIARYFNVTTDYLTGATDNPSEELPKIGSKGPSVPQNPSDEPVSGRASTPAPKRKVTLTIEDSAEEELIYLFRNASDEARAFAVDILEKSARMERELRRAQNGTVFYVRSDLTDKLQARLSDKLQARLSDEKYELVEVEPGIAVMQKKEDE